MLFIERGSWESWVFTLLWLQSHSQLIVLGTKSILAGSCGFLIALKVEGCIRGIKGCIVVELQETVWWYGIHEIYWLLLLLARIPTSATASDIKEAYYKQSLKLYVILCSTVHLIYTRQFYIKDWYVAFVLTRCVAAIQMKILIQRPRRTFKKLLLLLRYSSGIVILLPGFCICAPKCHHWRLMLGSLLQAQILNMVEFWCLARSWKMKRSGNNMTMRLLIPRRLATSFPQDHIQIECVYVHASLVHLRYIWILKIL